jgi:hypothetical protein
MADDNQDPLLQEALQRQQDVAPSGRVNVVPPVAPPTGQPVRGIDLTSAQEYAQRGLAPGSTLVGPTANIGQQPTPEQQQQYGIGNHIDAFGNPLGPTHDLSGNPNPAPPGAVGIQGIVATAPGTGPAGSGGMSEQAFWQANPLGAVRHPQTGDLIGLGNSEAVKQARLASIGQGAPGTAAAAPKLPAPDFVQVPEIDKGNLARIQEMDQEIAAKQAELQTASTQRTGGGRRGGGSISQPSQHDILTRDINTLRELRTGLSQNYHQQMQAAFEATKLNTEMGFKHDVAQDALGAHMALSAITDDPGSPEAKQAIAKIRADFPMAIYDPETKAKLLEAATFHDVQGEFLQRAQAAGYLPKMVSISSKGPDYKLEGTTEQMESINKELKERGLPFGANAIFNNAVGKGIEGPDNRPYEQLKPDDILKVPYIDKKGDQQEANVKKSTLESLKKEFNERYKAAGGTFQQGTAIPTGATNPVQQGATTKAGFIAGQVYTDANGNKAIHNADGTWMPITQ